MNVYLIIEDTFRADYAQPLEDIFTLVYKNHCVSTNWTLPSLGDILTGYLDNGMKWEWHTDDLKDEDLMMEVLSGKLSKPTLAEYLTCKKIGYVGGNFVNGKYGFSRGFDEWYEEPFCFMDYKEPEKQYKNSFTLFHQYYIHDYFMPLGWNMKSYKENKFKDISGSTMLEGIESYKNRVLILKARLLDFMSLHKDDIIILTADHGEAFGEHQDSYHHGVYSLMEKEIYNVPLMIKIPGYEKMEITQLSRSIDIVPTILSLYKKNISKFPGVNLLNMAKGKQYNLSLSSTFYYRTDKYQFNINNEGSSYEKI